MTESLLRTASRNALATAACVAGAWLAAAARVASPREVVDDAALVAATTAIDAGEGQVLIASGDIALCRDLKGAMATARLVQVLLDAHPGARVITTGDHTYPDGAAHEFTDCYEPTWGAFNAVTAPTPGNHDYDTDGAAPYFDYFELYRRDPAARSRGYYAFDAGAWRVLSLNSNVAMAADSAQVRWLEAELGATDARCVLAYWHHPLYSSGWHGLQRRDAGRDTDAFWNALSLFDAELVVNGHTHMYERFAPQTVRGTADPNGITQIVVGTGGASFDRAFGQRENSVYLNNDVHGVLVLMLHATSYEWLFIGTDGTIHDRSAAPVACH